MLLWGSKTLYPLFLYTGTFVSVIIGREADDKDCVKWNKKEKCMKYDMVMEIKTVKIKHQLLMLQTDKNIRKDNPTIKN